MARVATRHSSVYKKRLSKKSDDQTILAWSRDSKEDPDEDLEDLAFGGALVRKPADFANYGHFIPDELAIDGDLSS